MAEMWGPVGLIDDLIDRIDGLYILTIQKPDYYYRPVIEGFPKYRMNTGFFSSKYRIYRPILSQIQDIQDKLREKYC